MRFGVADYHFRCRSIETDDGKAVALWIMGDWYHPPSEGEMEPASKAEVDRWMKEIHDGNARKP